METHGDLETTGITDTLVAHTNRQPSGLLMLDATRFLVNLGLEERIVSGNLFEHLVDSDIEELMIDANDLRKDSKEMGLRLGTISSPSLREAMLSSSTLSSPSPSSRRNLPFLSPFQEASSPVDDLTRSLSTVASVTSSTISRTPSLHSLARPVPRGGYLVNLIKHLIIGGNQDLLDCFILTLQTFTSPLVLFRNLLHLFKRKAGPDALTADKEEVVLKKERVLFFLVRWLSRNPEDFKEHSLLATVQGFIDRQSKTHISVFWEQLARLVRGEPLTPKPPVPALCNHNAIYQKTRESVFHHTLPVVEEEAVTLAAIQFQVENQIESSEFTEE